ncbi:MAG: four helix bundle protein [Acidobacteriia bacterium]|nr:four helix bundle protein [Terriglobia bacterium]
MSEKTGNSKLETRNSRVIGIVPRKTGAIRDFKDLEVWRAARELRKEVYQLARLLPEIEKFGLASQLRRAACFVTANIAEGFGRFGYQENAQLCRQARGSLYEVRDHLTTCVDEGYVSLDEGTRLDKLAQRVTQLLNGYLRSTLALKAATHE